MSDAPAEPVRGWRTHRAKIAVSLIVAGVFVWMLQVGALPLMPPSSAFRQLAGFDVAVYVCIYALAHYIRAARWHWLLTPFARVSHLRIMRVSMLGFGAIAMFPFRTGEFVRPLLIQRGQKMSAWEATGTIGAERIIDGLVLNLILLAGLASATMVDPLPTRLGELPISVGLVPTAAYSALSIFIAAFVAMGLFYWRRAFARRLTERTIGLISPRLASWLAARVERLAEGLGFLRNGRFAAPFVGATVGYWLLNAAGSWWLMRSCGFSEATFAQACVVMGVLALGVLVPNAPGFFGAFQFAVYAGLAMFFPPGAVMDIGAAFVFVLYCAQIGVTLAGAGLGALLPNPSGS